MSSPFAAASAASEATLAESAAYVRLCNELTRYVKEEITGRSFLISGHRGAGKTTLVLKAIEDIRKKNLGCMPLLIPLHGPDLLLPPGADSNAQAPAAEDAESSKEAEGAKEADKNSNKEKNAHPEAASTPANGKPASGKNAEAAAPASPTARDTEQFLRQVTIGIYRALADLFYEAYRHVAELKARSGLPAWRELPELAAQLRIELDGAPDVSLLREFWRRAGALERGIIALAQYKEIPTPPGMVEPSPSAIDPNRGMLELVALYSASQAYKVVSGKLETKEKQEQNAALNQSVAFQTVAAVKNLLNPLLGVVAGGVVGLGLKSISTMAAALAGTATGLGTALTLNYSSSRSRENTRSTEMTFLPDKTITSLDRVLPLLVKRCRQAGIAPVFVVDELDKVPDLPERMGPLVGHLKSLVTEKSFFCFLADRDYLERLRRDLATTPYRTEYTYFSDRLFVLYRPDDLHKYLLSDKDESGKYLSGLLQPSDLKDTNEMTDLQVLPYVLLHRSRMHPFDLRRQLAMLRNDQGVVCLSPGVVRTELAYRFDVLIQVAVEWLLDQPKLRERLNQDEDFTQLAYDTLYYPSRKWEQGSRELDVSREAFLKYLGERMSLNQGQNKNGGKKEKQEKEKCPLSDLDQDFLYDRLLELLGFLVEPVRLVNAIDPTRGKPFHTYVIQAIPLEPKLKLLDYRDGNRDKYVWRIDVFGRPLEPAGVEAIKRDMKPQDKFIQDVQAALSAIGPNVKLHQLATEFGVLRVTPAWSAVQPALRRLRRLWTDERPQAYGEMESDATAVWEYSRMLEASGVTLAEALIAGMILGQIAGAVEGAGANMQEQKLLQGLSILSWQLRLRGLLSADTADQLQRAMEELKTALGLRFDDAPFTLNAVSVNQWAAAITKTLTDPKLNALSRNTPEVVAANNEKEWRERFREYFRNGTTTFDPKAVDLICAAASTGLATVLSPDLSEVVILNWSALLLQSFADGLYPGQVPFPAIFGVPALFQLGFGKLVTDAVKTGRMFQPSSVAPSKIQSLRAEQGEIFDWVFSVRKPPVEMPGVLVVVDGSDEPPLWKTSAKYAALMVNKTQLVPLRQALQGIWTQSMFRRVVVEVAPTPPTPISTLVQQPPLDVGSLYPEVASLPYSYFSQTAPPVPVPTTPFVSAPKNLDEAVDLTTPATPPIAANAAPA